MTIKYLLTMDTSGGSASACVYDCASNKSLADEYHDQQYNQGEIIIPMIDRLIQKSGIAKSDIGAIGVCRGPGFFTGLRIGLSTANALALGLNVDIYAVDSLSTMAFESGVDDITVIGETKRSDFYVGYFRGGKITGEIQALESDEIKIGNESLIGSGVNRYLAGKQTDNEIIKQDFPTSVGIAGLIVKNGFVDTDNSPLYLRSADVSQPKVK